MSLEMIWLLVPICGLLSQLGGSDYAPKAIRRFGIPLAMVVAILLFHGWTWWVLPMLLTQWGAYTLPFTLVGDSVPGKAINWLWLPIWGILLCVSSLWITLLIWPGVLAVGLLVGLLGAASNLPWYSRWMQWKLVELFIGAGPAICTCWSLTIL